MSEADLGVRVNSCGRTTCAPDWNWDTSPGLPDYDLITIHGGAGEYRDGETVCPVRAGSCLLFRRGGRYRGSMRPDQPMTVTWVHFDYRSPGGAARAPRAGELPALHRVLENAQFFYSLLERLLAAGRDGRGREAELWLSAALAELLHQDARPRWQGHRLEQARGIEEICARIRAEPGARWRLPAMARRLYCSPDHFARLFRKHAGSSPGDFVVRARIDAAMGLLRSSSHSVKRIAELLGYADVCAFSRQFRQKTGQAPTAYRRGAGPSA